MQLDKNIIYMDEYIINLTPTVCVRMQQYFIALCHKFYIGIYILSSRTCKCDITYIYNMYGSFVLARTFFLKLSISPYKPKNINKARKALARKFLLSRN